jgi:hypothetical protein
MRNLDQTQNILKFFIITFVFTTYFSGNIPQLNIMLLFTLN